ncbi:hypothetical protein [Halocatena salina]|uniref:Uncharacterized protein n=1 Tax=Halocatena salina TaxID=2934340 RepID=A0A8U0A208_9EURY|nr:hypothetical protein [Halocatena salina]UPM43104.1 hypothetical protein MW046_01325 [Halocatena salina]
MDPNDTDVEKSIGCDQNDEPVARETCIKPWCEAAVNTRISKEEDGSVEIKRCAKGHFVRKRLLDVDGEAYRTFRSILGP